MAPKSKRRLIAEFAASADGFIARPDGSFDWIERAISSPDPGMARFYRSVDTVIWGRKTYELALRTLKKYGTGPDPQMRNVVFSRTRRTFPGAERVSGSVPAFVAKLRATPGKNVWLMGGAGLFASFLDAGELDELSVRVLPVLIGDGIPLFSPRRREVALRLRSTRRFGDGSVRLHYDVLGAQAERGAKPRR